MREIFVFLLSRPTLELDGVVFSFLLFELRTGTRLVPAPLRPFQHKMSASQNLILLKGGFRNFSFGSTRCPTMQILLLADLAFPISGLGA
jgi:hypothetical protein